MDTVYPLLGQAVAELIMEIDALIRKFNSRHLWSNLLSKHRWHGMEASVS